MSPDLEHDNQETDTVDLVAALRESIHAAHRVRRMRRIDQDHRRQTNDDATKPRS